MIDGVNNLTVLPQPLKASKYDTITVKEPKTYEKYEYEVDIDGKKQTAKVEKAMTSRGQHLLRMKSVN